MHNNVNKRTGKRSDWTIQEFINNFTYNYMSDGSELSRADKKRREDHKYIAELKSRKPFDVINIITLVTCILILLVIIFRIIFEKRRIPKSFFPIWDVLYYGSHILIQCTSCVHFVCLTRMQCTSCMRTITLSPLFC